MQLNWVFFVPKIISKGSDLLEFFENVTRVWFLLRQGVDTDRYRQIVVTQ